MKTDKEFIAIGISKLKTYQKMTDTSKAHRRADRVLIHILKRLGCAPIAQEWKKVDKWYD